MRFRLPLNHSKPSKASSNDEARPALLGGTVRKTADGAELITTDSYKMVVTPLEITEGEVREILIPAPALKMIESGDSREARIENGHVIPLATGGRSLGVLFEHPDLPAPKFRHTLDELDAKHAAIKQTDRFVLGLNADFLKEIAEALGASHGGSSVRITIDLSKVRNGRYEHALRVDGEGSDGRAYLMPIRAVDR